MISQKLQTAINNQINKELFSEYYYLSMASYFNSVGLDGFENFFLIQVQEERFHAMKMYRFLNERGGRVILSQIDTPKTEFTSSQISSRKTKKKEMGDPWAGETLCPEMIKWVKEVLGGDAAQEEDDGEENSCGRGCIPDTGLN